MLRKFATSSLRSKGNSFSKRFAGRARGAVIPSDVRNKDHDPSKYQPHKSDILLDPKFNKGTAFTEEERDAFNLRGLLPPTVENMDQQVARVYEQFKNYEKPINKYVFLNMLQLRNETVFYRLVMQHLKEIIPVIYTPTVGEACQRFCHLFRGQQGMYISLFKDRGRVRSILDNWPYEDPSIIVVTDGSRILGLGDLGTNGMGIPIGKLSLYIAGAGFHPSRTLPVTLDVGTNNPALMNDPVYLGDHKPRVRGEIFYRFVDEFLAAVKEKWPNTLVQFEDFSNDVCFELLERNRDKLLCFNDDIQGTGAVIVAGFINAMKIQGIGAAQQKLVFCGAGSAAVGVADQIAIELASQQGISVEQARLQIYFVDSKGLVRFGRDSTLPPHKAKYARHDVTSNIGTLEQVVKEIKPTALIGLSGTAKEFNESIIREMAKNNERPIIFALSNPTSKSECSAAEAFTLTNGKAIFAAGSPFPDFEYQGKIHKTSQGNNMYIFPGLGLGAVIAKATKVSDTMIVQAAKSLSEQTSQESLANGDLYPDLNDIRKISRTIAKTVAHKAFTEGLSGYPQEPDWDALLDQFVYEPNYVEHK